MDYSALSKVAKLVLRQDGARDHENMEDNVGDSLGGKEGAADGSPVQLTDVEIYVDFREKGNGLSEENVSMKEIYSDLGFV